jgi:hypothetical protein
MHKSDETFVWPRRRRPGTIYTSRAGGFFDIERMS